MDRLHRIAKNVTNEESSDDSSIDTVEDPDILLPITEYSIQIDLSISANFEGKTTKKDLVKRFKEELISAIRSSMSLTASALDLNPIGARVTPIKIQFEVNEEYDPGRVPS